MVMLMTCWWHPWHPHAPAAIAATAPGQTAGHGRDHQGVQALRNCGAAAQRDWEKKWSEAVHSLISIIHVCMCIYIIFIYILIIIIIISSSSNYYCY